MRLCPNMSPAIIRNLSLYLKLIHACIAYFWKVIASHVKYFASILRAIGPNPRMCHLRAQTKNYAYTQSLLRCYLYVLTLSINIFASLFVLFYLSLSQKFWAEIIFSLFLPLFLNTSDWFLYSWDILFHCNSFGNQMEKRPFGIFPHGKKTFWHFSTWKNAFSKERPFSLWKMGFIPHGKSFL